MKKRKNLIVLIVICIILFLIPIVLYILNFGSSSVSSNSSDWGTFGDYFGGIINPILGIANLGVIFYISILLSKHDDRRLLNQMIFDLHNNIHTELDKLDLKHYNSESAKSTYKYLTGVGYKEGYLFEEHEKDFFRLSYDLALSIVAISTYRERFLSPNQNEINVFKINDRYLANDYSQDEEVSLEMLGMAVQKYQMYKHKLTLFMRATIINRPVVEILKEDVEGTAKEEWKKTNEIFAKHVGENLNVF